MFYKSNITVRLCQVLVSADERKKWASSEIVKESKMAGQEKGKARKYLFKYLNLPTSWKTVSHQGKKSHSFTLFALDDWNS